MSDSPEMFTVLNELHHAIEDGWHRHQYCSPVTENLRPQPLQLNLTVHADIAGDDTLSGFLRKLRADLKDQWERSGSSHGVHAGSLAALVDITATVSSDAARHRHASGLRGHPQGACRMSSRRRSPRGCMTRPWNSLPRKYRRN